MPRSNISKKPSRFRRLLLHECHSSVAMKRLCDSPETCSNFAGLTQVLEFQAKPGPTVLCKKSRDLGNDWFQASDTRFHQGRRLAGNAWLVGCTSRSFCPQHRP